MTQEEMLLEAAQTGASHDIPLVILYLSGCYVNLAPNLIAWHENHVAEIMNLRNLEKVLAREEEVKKKAIVNKAVYSGPQIRYLSKNGKLPLFPSKHHESAVLIETSAG